MNIRILASTLALAIPSLVVAESDLPPENARPLSEIVEAVESQGYAPVELEFEDGHWEITAMREGKAVKLYVDPLSASISERDKRP
jgi:hypothetical protein